MTTRQTADAAICAHVAVTDSTNLYGGYNCKAVEGKILDVSSKGNDAPLTGQVPEPHILGPALCECGVGSVNTGIDATQLNPRTESHTVCGWVQVISSTTNYTSMLGKGIGGGTYVVFPNGGISRINANSKIRYSHYTGSSYVYVNAAANTAINGSMVHVGYTVDHTSTLVTLYVDGVASGTLANTAMVTKAAVDADGFRIGGGNTTNAANGELKGLIIAPQFYKEVKSADWFAAEYAKAATALWHTTPGADVSTASITAGQIENTLFEVNSGSFKISESGDTKSLECVSAGTVSARTISMHHSATEAAYGTWEFSTTGASSTMIIASVAGAYNAAAQNGYQIEIDAAGALKLQRITSGAVATTLLTTANGTITLTARTRIVVTRSNTGIFTVYADGVKLTATAGANPSTDNTHTDSDYLTLTPATNSLYTYCDKCGGNAITKRLITVAPE